jgi:hypothetical protein
VQAPKETISLSPLQHCEKLVPLETSKAGKDVSFEQAIHVALKLVPLERSIPAGKEVKPTLLQPYHDMLKFVEFDRSSAGKEVKPVQPFHALVKLVPAVRGMAGKVAREVQFCHALMKFVPEFRPVARKEVSKEFPYHA